MASRGDQVRSRRIRSGSLSSPRPWQKYRVREGARARARVRLTPSARPAPGARRPAPSRRWGRSRHRAPPFRAPCWPVQPSKAGRQLEIQPLSLPVYGTGRGSGRPMGDGSPAPPTIRRSPQPRGPIGRRSGSRIAMPDEGTTPRARWCPAGVEVAGRQRWGEWYSTMEPNSETPVSIKRKRIPMCDSPGFRPRGRAHGRTRESGGDQWCQTPSIAQESWQVHDGRR